MIDLDNTDNQDLFFDDDDLEEGEIVPEPDLNNIFKTPYGFNQFEDPVPEDPSVEEKQALELRRNQVKERMLQVPFQSNTKVLNFMVFAELDGASIPIDFEINLTRSFNSNDYPVPLRDDDPLQVVDRFVPGYKIDEWRYKKDHMKPNLYWTHISDKDAAKYKSIIWSWFYDAELKLFILKRPEGCQYLAFKERHFRSLCEDDLHELGNNWIINPSNDGLADVICKNLRQDFWSRKNVKGSEKPKLHIEPRPLKRVVKPDKSVEFVQQDIKCMIKVPAKKWKQDVLDKMDNWEIDRDTGEAKMYADREKKILLRSVYDPMQLVNFSRKDQRKLYDTECSFLPYWRFEESRYRKILQICLHENIHANSIRLLFNG